MEYLWHSFCFYIIKTMEITDIKTSLPNVLFVTGIGTDVGKSWATGWLARELRRQGVNAITQKFIQTGNKDYSEDIAVHRKVMGIDDQPRDLDHTTAPLILSYPASPHLAARLDGVDVDYETATRATQRLLQEYDCVLVEGAGGIAVPLHDQYLALDFLRDHKLPAVVVVNGQLGSINHAILTFRVLQSEGVEIWGVVYNPFFDSDEIISHETQNYLCRWVKDFLPGTKFLMMPHNL